MDSLVLLTVDCLRADHLGCYGYERPTSPNIDAFATTATLYKYSYSNCPGTRWAFQSLHTGVSTARIDGLGIPKDYRTLASHLNRADYETGGFADNGFVSRDYGYDTGFDTYYSVEDTQKETSQVLQAGKRVKEKLNSQIVNKFILDPARDAYRRFESNNHGFFKASHTDADTVEIALSFIGNQQAADRDYFVWIHFMDAHTPYSHRPEHLDALGADSNQHTVHPGDNGLVVKGEPSPSVVIDTYDAGIREVDRQVGRILDTVEDDATVVFTGDHGEEFGCYGEFHEASLHSSMTDVPIIVRAEEIDSGVSRMPAQHLDIPPTLLAAAGAEVPDYWEGVPLQDLDRSPDDPIVFTLGDEEIAVRVGEWKYLRVGECETLYAAGHGEKDPVDGDVTTANPEVLEWCRSVADAYLNQPVIGEGFRALEDGKDNLSDEVHDNLEDLGYL